VLKSLTSQYADLRRHLYNDEGKLRSFVNVYVNDEDIRYLNKEATPLKDGDTVSIVPSIAGGSAGVAAAPPISLFQRRDPALQPPPDHAGSRHGRAVEAEERQGALIGTGGLGAPLGMYLAAAGSGASAWWISTSSISPTCSAR
jgi:sulfur-carrier protein adenylyltransferase/sulfurtransferase